MGRKPVDIASLQATIRRIECGGTAFARSVVATGHSGLDGHLPGGGFWRGACYEIGGAAASGLAAALAGRALAAGGYLFWCQSDADIRRHGGIYGPGLAEFGIAPQRFVHVRTRDPAALLWASEEIARSRAVACLVAETGALDLLVSRRLQLAAEEGGGLALLLRHGPRDLRPSAVVGRLEAMPIGPRWGGRGWQVELWRAKGCAPGRWDAVWQKGQENALSLDPNPGFLACPHEFGEPAAGAALAS